MKEDLDIYTINTLYLLKIKELAIACETRKAAIIAGASVEMIQRIASLPINKLLSIANSGIISYQLRIPDRLLQDLDANAYPEDIVQARIALAVSGDTHALKS